MSLAVCLNVQEAQQKVGLVHSNTVRKINYAIQKEKSKMIHQRFLDSKPHSHAHTHYGLYHHILYKCIIRHKLLAGNYVTVY